MDGKALLEELKKEKKDKGDTRENFSIVFGTKVTPMGITVSERQPFLLEGACMRDYQLEGFEWLKLLYLNGVNGILADEMGLGKTIQTISLICFMIENKLPGPYLIVAPLSTLANWINEFNAFCPRVRTC
jgi:ATP-dependent DNA helicase